MAKSGQTEMLLGRITSKRRRSNVAAILAIAIVTAVVSLPLVANALGGGAPRVSVTQLISATPTEVAASHASGPGAI